MKKKTLLLDAAIIPQISFLMDEILSLAHKEIQRIKTQPELNSSDIKNILDITKTLTLISSEQEKEYKKDLITNLTNEDKLKYLAELSQKYLK